MKKVKNIQWNCCRLVSINSLQFCPRKIVKSCCAESYRRDRFLLERVEKTREKIHITYILKSIRVLKFLARRNLTKQEWKDI